MRYFRYLLRHALFFTLLLTVVSAAQAGPDAAARINAALRDLRFPAGSALTSISFKNGALRAEFNSAATQGLSEGGLEGLNDAVRAAYAGADMRSIELDSGGRLLSSYLPPVPMVPPAEQSVGPLSVTSGALSGKSITLSPGHGLTYYGSGSALDQNPTWHLQRSYFFGIVEDYMNQEFVEYLYNLLVNNGATVYATREMDKSAGVDSETYTFAGLTRPALADIPWWQMAAVYYTKHIGAPSSVWDAGFTSDYNRDIDARPLYSNYRNTDIMVSLHNNAAGGSGTTTLYDTINGYTNADKNGGTAAGVGSETLATKIQDHVVSQIRANYNADWKDRGLLASAGGYGENRIATRPAALIEVAFFDMQTPDNNAQHDEKFKMLVARGIYEGICDYFGRTPTYNTNVTASSGSWTAQALTKAWTLSLGAAINAPVSSAGGWVYAGTDAGIAYGVAGSAASGSTPGTLKWKYPASGSMGAAIHARPTVYGNAVYFVTVAGKLVALNRLSGGLLWSVTVPNAGNVTSSPSPTADGRVVIGSDNGRIYAYRQTNGALLSTFPTGAAFGAINSTIAVPDASRIWVTSADGSVRRLSGDLTAVLWEQDTGSPIASSPYVLTANNAVYLTNALHTLFAFNASTGSVFGGWGPNGVSLASTTSGSPWVDAATNGVTVGLDNHSLTAIDAGTAATLSGNVLRPYGVKEFAATPVILNNTLYAGGTDGKFYALARSNGVTNPWAAWRVYDSETDPLPGQFSTTACVTGVGANDLVVAGNTNGVLYGFGIVSF